MKIDKSAVIRVIENIRNKKPYGPNNLYINVNDLVNEINTLPASEDEWVSVSERFPESGVEVRVALINPNGTVVESHAKWWDGFIQDFDHVMSKSITHWQYITLPSPPTK